MVSSGLICDLIIDCLYILCEGSTFYEVEPEKNGPTEIVAVCKDCNLIICDDLNVRTVVGEEFLIDEDVSFIHDFD